MPRIKYCVYSIAQSIYKQNGSQSYKFVNSLLPSLVTYRLLQIISNVIALIPPIQRQYHLQTFLSNTNSSNSIDWNVKLIASFKSDKLAVISPFCNFLHTGQLLLTIVAMCRYRYWFFPSIRQRVQGEHAVSFQRFFRER